MTFEKYVKREIDDLRYKLRSCGIDGECGHCIEFGILEAALGTTLEKWTALSKQEESLSEPLTKEAKDEFKEPKELAALWKVFEEIRAITHLINEVPR